MAQERVGTLDRNMIERDGVSTGSLPFCRQILGAINHLKRNEKECAITLALAAEGQLPATDRPHLLMLLREAAPDLAKDGTFNLHRDWLKTLGPETNQMRVVISTFDVAIALMRAISKFEAVYEQSHPEFVSILKMVRRRRISNARALEIGPSARFLRLSRQAQSPLSVLLGVGLLDLHLIMRLGRRAQHAPRDFYRSIRPNRCRFCHG